jgi:hypothetical protein
MNIRPLEGVENINFGMRSSTVKSIIGKPEEIIKKGLKFEDDEVWSFYNKGLILEFDCCFEFRLSKIVIKDKTALIKNSTVIEENEKKLLKLIPSIKLDYDFTHPVKKNNFKEYSHSKLGLEFHLINNVINKIILEPDPSLDFMRYCSRYRQKAFYSRRYTNKYLREKEKGIAIQFSNQMNKFRELNNINFVNDWFLGSCLGINPNLYKYWCDGVIIKGFYTRPNQVIHLEAIATILSSKNDSFFEECEFKGYIEVNKSGNQLKGYKLSLNIQGSNIVFQKNKKPALSVR